MCDAHLSYLDARRAAEVAQVLKVPGNVVHHPRLGVYRLLADLPLDSLRRNVHPGLHRLLRYDAGHGMLTDTLEAYLDNAADAKRTAAQLQIHRASLHYRLKRIHEITQLDLAVGDDRLGIHLSLKIARLLGLR